MLAKLRAHYPEHQHKEEEEKEEEEEKTRNSELRQDTAHTTAILPNTNHHRYPTMIQPCHKDTTLNQQCCDNKHAKGGAMQRGSKTIREGARQYKTGEPNRTRGTAAHTAPRHSTGPPCKLERDANTQTGDTDIRRGVSNTAALPSPCHPPPQ